MTYARRSGGLLPAIGLALLVNCGTTSAPTHSGAMNSGSSGETSVVTTTGSMTTTSTVTTTGTMTATGTTTATSTTTTSTGSSTSFATATSTASATSVGDAGASVGADAGIRSDMQGDAGPSLAMAFSADRVIITGVRGTASPPAQTVINLHNAGQTAAEVTSLSLSGADSAQFLVTTPAPAMIAPGSDLQVTVQMATTGADLPALPPGPPPYDSGSNLSMATLTAATSAGSLQASVYGLLLVQALPVAYEPTLGQILTTLGYPINVGQAQNDWNPNTSMLAADLPGVEPHSDEIAAPSFVKAAAGSVTMSVIARFSPEGLLPYGWYPSGAAAPATNEALVTGAVTVGTMSMITDPQTSNKARMVFPPLAAGSATTFDPGAVPFGIWVYSDQFTETWNEGGNPVNGNYDYSQDALNTDSLNANRTANVPSAVHRMKVYPIKNAAGTVVPQTYMVAVEEAANGDYQDYVFLLGNVNVAP